MEQESIERITISFPRGVQIPNQLKHDLSALIGKIAKANSSDMWVFGEGYAHSNPFIEPMVMDYTGWFIEVNET